MSLSEVTTKDIPPDRLYRASNSRKSSVTTGKHDIADMVIASKPQQEDTQTSPTDERYTIVLLDALVIF